MQSIIPEKIIIPQIALDELREIMLKQVGQYYSFSDNDIKHLGTFLLTLTATAIKVKMQQQSVFKKNTIEKDA